MIVRVTDAEPDPVTVTDQEVLDALEVRIGDLTADRVDALLRASGLGTADREHAWLDVGELRARCAGRDQEWQRGFDAMLRAARRHGWTSEDGSRVRAHLVR